MSKPMAAIAAAISVGAAWLGAAGPVQAHAYDSTKAPAGSPFAPYAFLVGDWDVTMAGHPGTLVVLRFRWAANQAYLTYSGAMVEGGREQPHFEGVLMWNGVHRNLDMLLNVDPKRGLAQEQGTMSVGADGVVIRDITAVYSQGVTPLGGATAGPGGATDHFRQTFRAIDEDHVRTDALHEVGGKWLPTFEGAGDLLMTRREPHSH